MTQIVGYFPDGQTWRKKDEQRYRIIFNHDFAIAYLRNEIDESIEREMSCISDGGNAGFYATIRFLFPEINHLSNLYFGNIENRKEPEYTCRYMKKFSILSPAPGLYWEVFRNGLLHSHHPKWLRKTKGCWYISNNEKLDGQFGIFTHQLAEEIRASIKKFTSELKAEKHRGEKVKMSNVLNVLVKCGKYITKKDLKEKDYAYKDFSKLKVKNRPAPE